MPTKQHPNSRANLQPNHGHPVGTRVKATNGYYRVKVDKDYPYTHHNYWAYTHYKLAEESLGRKLEPNERIWFINENADKKWPDIADIEVRIVAIQSGKPPGRRKYWARKVIELRQQLQEAENMLGALNEFYGRPRDDVSDAFETREWNGRS